MGPISIYHFRGAAIEYRVMGSGPHHVLAFHGFGQQADVFAPLAEALASFTIHSFSLFWHGNSEAPPEYRVGDIPLPPDFYPELVAAYTTAKGIDRFSLLGNSMGGRISLLLAEPFASRLEHLFLLAPDGVRKSFWYQFATHNRLGKSIFRYSLHHPGFFFRTVRFFRFLGLVTPKMEKFTVSQFSTEENRRKVFCVWNLYADIVPGLDATKQALKKYEVTGCIFTGKRDPVLGKDIGEKFLEGLEGNFVHLPLESGHELLKGHLLPVIVQAISERTEKRKPSPSATEEGNMDQTL